MGTWGDVFNRIIESLGSLGEKKLVSEAAQPDRYLEGKRRRKKLKKKKHNKTKQRLNIFIGAYGILEDVTGA